VIGIVLIIGLTLAAASAVVVFGSSAIDDGRQQSRVGQAEQAMTQFDSRAAQVALGESDVQTIRIGQGSGDYRVNASAGSVRVFHENYNQWNDTEIVFGPEPLGAVVYESEDTTIAYQGGGVWRSDGADSSVMVSPPEFHYRAATLTFPIIRLEGSGAASGSVSARVSSDVRAKQIFANSSETYDNETSRQYHNPVQNGNMTVEIQSQYCEGWRSYFEARIDGDVDDFCSLNNTVRAQLVTLGTQGAFPIQGQNTVRLRGMKDDHPLENLELRFVSDSNSEFKNFEWKLSGTDDAGNEIGIAFLGGGMPCKNDQEPVRTVVYYNNASNDDYGAFVIPETSPHAFETACDNGEDVLEVDLLNGSKTVTYTDLDSADPFDPDGSLHDRESFNEHGGITGEPTSFTSGDQTNLEFVVQHYFSLLGDADLQTSEKQKGDAGLGASSAGDIQYSGGGRVVTFLHITDNRLEVDLR
jgi:hypothetical protein